MARDISLLPGTANTALSGAIAARMGIGLTEVRAERFPDGEWDIAVDPNVRGTDVYLIQSLAPPVNDHLVALVLLLDASRRSGARRSTAVIPYLGYARKDRRTARGEAVSLRVIADMLESSGAERAVLVDPHMPQVDSVFSIPLEVVSAVPRIADALRATVDRSTTVVAPDIGAVHLAERYARELELERVAVVRKRRRGGSDVDVTGLIGDGTQRPVLLVDDLISTGATLEAAAGAIRAAWATPELSIAATHGVFVESSRQRLDRVAPTTLVLSDTVELADPPHFCRIVSLAELLADTITQLHDPGGTS
jgi:ribose-phosphate pyrophosphokinase